MTTVDPAAVVAALTEDGARWLDGVLAADITMPAADDVAAALAAEDGLTVADVAARTGAGQLRVRRAVAELAGVGWVRVVAPAGVRPLTLGRLYRNAPGGEGCSA